MLVRYEMLRARSRDAMMELLSLCVEYRAGRVHKGGVPGSARCLSWGFAEGDGCTEVRPETLVAGGERGEEGDATAMMQRLVEGGGGEEVVEAVVVVV